MIAVRAEGVKPSPRIGVAFAAIPLDVLRSRHVSPAARLAFAALANHARMRRADVSTLTNRRLAEAAGLSVASARRALDELEAAGLVRRLFGDSKRTRLGVGITYQAPAGVAQPEATALGGVAQPAQPGCSPAPPGGCAPGATDLLRAGEKTRESDSIPPPIGEDEDPASRIADGPEGAQYMRLCIDAAKHGRPMPPPPGVRPPDREPPAPTPTVAARGVGGPPPARPVASPLRDATRREIEAMVGSLAFGFGEALRRPRRPARRTAEARRRPGCV